jgi:hypothetical protein
MHVDGQLCMSIFHYQYDSGSVIPDGQVALTDFLNKIRVAGKLKDKYLACIPDVVNDVTWHAQWIIPTRYRVTELAIPADAGLVPTAPMPSAVAVAITKRGELANRHNIGTLHMPAVPNTFVAQSMLTAPGFLAYDDLGTQVKEPVTLTGGQLMNPVILNKADYILSPTILTTVTQPTSRVNRRRTVGLGA